MPKAQTNGIELEYETFGNTEHFPVLLVTGWGLQLIAWPEGFCQSLLDRGCYLIRFDNRDVGLSTKIDSGGVPDIFGMLSKKSLGQPVDAPYLIKDMAADTVGLLDALHIRSAHIVGLSLGGMVAQTIAIEYPERIRSLVSIMSTTGRAGLPGPTKEVLSEVMKMPRERDACIAHVMNIERVLTADVFPFETERARDYATRSYDRSFHPRGLVRQFAAIIASESRADELKSVQVPTLVIHGNRDPLIHIECGRDTARSIPGARFFEIEGMGHYLSKAIWPTLVHAITAFISMCESRAAPREIGC
jgi:pimeloyl-ACP methyl ester carboxylesterase